MTVFSDSLGLLSSKVIENKVQLVSFNVKAVAAKPSLRVGKVGGEIKITLGLNASDDLPRDSNSHMERKASLPRSRLLKLDVTSRNLSGALILRILATVKKKKSEKTILK